MKRLLLFLLILGVYTGGAQARVLYVDASATGTATGASWANAYTTLSAALAASASTTTTDSILIAAGTYYPTGAQSNTQRDSAFAIYRGGIRLYGGYPAGGGVRNTTQNKVYLDGDIGAPGNPADNSYHVLVIAGLSATADTVLLDGLTIRNGTATGDNSAFQVANGKPLAQRFGGGVYIAYCHSPALIFNRCALLGNTALGAAGVVSPQREGATASGGGLRADSSIFQMRNCEIGRNICSGGISPASGVPSGASYGGGVALQACQAAFYNCCLFRNAARQTTYSNARPNPNPNPGPSPPAVKAGYGGAIYSNNSTLTVTNCAFARDTANQGFVSSLLLGAAIYSVGNGSHTIANSIFWKNKNGIVIPAARDTTAGVVGAGTISYSLSWKMLASGTGNILNADPLFVDTLTDNYRLKAASPAINAGSNAAVPSFLTTDLDGNTRITQTNVDMGPYENPAGGLVGNTTLCTGSQTVLSGYPAGGAYASSDTTILKVNDSTGTVTPLAAGTATVTYASGANAFSLALTVVVTPTLPGIVGGGGPAFCPGTTVALSNPTGGGVWTSANPTIATVNPVTGVVTGVDSGTATIRYTVAGASGTVCNAVATTTVSVLPKPFISLVGNFTTICTGIPARYTASATGNATLAWTSSNPAVATVSSNGTVNGVAPGSVVITVTATGANGCTSSRNSVALSILPSDTMPPITGPSVVCKGATISLSNTNPNGAWTSLDPTIAFVDNNGVVTGLAGGTAAIAYANFNNSCSFGAGKIITVIEVPLAATTGPNKVCLGHTITLSNTTAGGAWISGNPAIATVSSTGLVTGLAGGTAAIMYRKTAGSCTDSAVQDVAVWAVPPAPVITANGSLLATGWFMTYSWALNGTPIAGATGRTFTATASGNYTVTVTDSAGCTGTSAVYAATLGVNGVERGVNAVSFYPNPATDRINITASRPVRVLVATVDGRTVLKKENATDFSVAALPAGVYILMLCDSRTGTLLLREKLIRVE